MEKTLIAALSSAQKERILEDVGYTAAQLKADVQQIKEWLHQQSHLPPSRLNENDHFFEMYLTGCKGSLETVKRKLDNYYSFRSTSELFDVRDPEVPGYLSSLKQCEFAVLPQANADGQRLFLGTFVDIDPENFDFLNMSKIMANRSEVYLRMGHYSTQNYILFNCKGASPSLTLKMRPSLLRDLIFMLEFYVTSGGYEDILNYFSPDMLPSDYGGFSTNPTLKDYSEIWNEYDHLHREWYLNDLSEQNDESKRQNIDLPKNPYFGVHGSLKKLIID